MKNYTTTQNKLTHICLFQPYVRLAGTLEVSISITAKAGWDTGAVYFNHR